MNIKFLHPMNSLIPFTNRGVNSLLYPYDFDFSPTIFPIHSKVKQKKPDPSTGNASAKPLRKSKNKPAKARKLR